jgi:LysR family transcriptional regulator, regulator for metE and metH
MELRHFKMIREVAETKSLTKAAERLFLSQSALSHQLKEMETYCGTQLFIRQKKQMLLTKEGALLLETGKRILNEMEQALCAIRKMTDKEAGEIRLSAECYTTYHWLTNTLKDFRGQYPKVDIKIELDGTHNAMPCLLADKIDVGIFEENTNKAIAYTPLFCDEFFVIIPTAHTWARRKWLELKELHQEAYIMYDIPTEQSTIYKTIFKENLPPKVYHLPLTEVMLEMVRGGFGFCILPNWVVLPYIKNKDLAAVRLTRKGMKRTWYAGVLKDKVQPPYVAAFINRLARHMKTNEEQKMLRVA